MQELGETPVKDEGATGGRVRKIWLTADSCRLEDFLAVIAGEATFADYPLAAKIVDNVPIYEGEAVRAAARNEESRREMMAEWASVMLDGPGLIVLRDAVDANAVDEVTSVFFAIIDEQRRDNRSAGDHFAKPGANDRVWNALEKLALRDPAAFARYYASEAIAMAAESWLGTGYQVTSQVNCVNPGGEAQSAHRDYHMGFQSAEEILRFPLHAHQLSPVLTLQGAVAHCDMPVESGPTLYLPFSQRYAPGYLAWRKAEFIEYFNRHYVQLPLGKGDAAFFNPALFHAAGSNRTRDVRRIANLLQISSAYGRAMESVDRVKMVKALYPALRSGLALDPCAANVVAASAEGYAFPTNLDRDPPLGGLAPPSQAALMQRALAEGWDDAVFAQAVDEHARRRLT
jgi:ectoine hydroxylase-related dioxygenase (phytanoyl-CoA dioxygenase family)